MQDLEQIIEKITTRPDMWVGDNGFNTIAAFISGYDWAVQGYTGLTRNETELGCFRTWLVEKISQHQELPRNMNWEYYVGQGMGDFDKIVLLRNLFQEYKSEM